jgi:ATP-dependent helicase YprA (DUF1998 family)
MSVIKRRTCSELLNNQHDPHPFQIDASVLIACGNDTILIAPTGSGKTLVLAMPLLHHEKKTSVVVSPLQALETDQVKKMNVLGVPSLLIDTIDFADKEYRVGSVTHGLTIVASAERSVFSDPI